MTPLSTSIWSNSYFVISFAIISISLLVASVWLFAKYRKQRKLKSLVYLLISVALHLGLIFFLPSLHQSTPTNPTPVDKGQEQQSSSQVEFSTYNPDLEAVSSSDLAQSNLTPLPLAELTDSISEQSVETPGATIDDVSTDTTETSEILAPTPSALEITTETASSLTPPESEALPDLDSEFDSLLDDAFAGLDAIDPNTMIEESVASKETNQSNDDADSDLSDPPNNDDSQVNQLADQPTNPIDQTADDVATADSVEAMPAPTSDTASEIAESSQTPSMDSPEGTVLGQVENDFANRTGDAKQKALLGTGGSENTEISVKRALEYLVSQQRENGSWDPRTSHAGLERSPLGESRGSAGSHAETALTGLALLSLMGAGHTHQEGQYADAVYKGLAFLIHQQKPNGSMQGNAKIYEATYCHGMAALAMCEAAAITRDASAILSAERAIAHTQTLQHPITGGWRYTEGDPGDLSQLGWQAMVLDSGNRAGIAISDRSIIGVQRFLQSVQVGRSGGLASYRKGEAPTHTMTAEALATRILIGDKISKEAIEEAEAYLMLNLPGNGQDNYYYWYYATIGLHQLQNENWNQWNQALQQRLLTTQNPDGSWPTQTLWGGYGGKIYTTAMATLCLETYYRHTIRNNRQRIAQQPNQPLRR